MKDLLVVVDYQNDFVCGSLGFDEARGIYEGIRNRIENTLSDGGYLLFTKDTHTDDYLTTREGKFLPITHCISGTNGHELYGDLSEYLKRPGTVAIEKSGFGSDDIATHITALCNGKPQIIRLCGLVTNICVISNAILLHTAFQDADVKVLPNLCAAPGDTHQNALAVLRGMGLLEE